MDNNKIISFAAGLVIVFGVLLGIIFYLGSPTKPSPPPAQKVLSSEDLKDVSKQTTGLENFGNLPLVVTGDQIGRTNPFDGYK
ncbi:MAG: hypothetical protein NTZ65_04340 [Candidatus Berkelbacteria bacterium]|nr:hypothetical protein [Candidatus Berkelbacteria bacterium]